MPNPLEDKLKAIAAEIAGLEKEIAELSALHEDLYKSGQPIPIGGPKSQKKLDELYKKLNSARQVQLSYLLASISESSAHMEEATRGLQHSSESQLEVARAQSRAVDDLLGSSHRLEQFTIFVLIIGAINVFIIEYTAGLLNGPLGYATIVAFVVAILWLTLTAFRWTRIVRRRARNSLRLVT